MQVYALIHIIYNHGIHRIIEIERCYAMEINVEKNYGNQNLKGTALNTDYDRSETNGKCGIFQVFG
jgi:hypothetical protein